MEILSAAHGTAPLTRRTVLLISNQFLPGSRILTWKEVPKAPVPNRYTQPLRTDTVKCARNTFVFRQVREELQYEQWQGHAGASEYLTKFMVTDETGGSLDIANPVVHLDSSRDSNHTFAAWLSQQLARLANRFILRN
jgi:hypothetical protein